MFRSSIAVAVLSALSLNAHAVLFDQNVTSNFINGGGVNNGAFTVDLAGSLELGMRVHVRHDVVDNQPKNVFNSNGNGTYNQAAGEGIVANMGNPNVNRARWNFDWSINTSRDGLGSNIAASGLTFVIGLDTDASGGTNFVTINPFTPVPPATFLDNSFGNNTTLQGQGTEATDAASYAALAAGNNLVQNSWNYDFYDHLYAFDPTVSGLYNIYLAAFNDGQQVARTEILVCVGTVACPSQVVPEPGSLALLGLSLAGLGYARRRRKA